MQQMGRRFWIECACAIACGLLLALTLVTREWIELIAHADPDRGSGLLEWAVVAILALATSLLTYAAGSERRRILARAEVRRSSALRA